MKKLMIPVIAGVIGLGLLIAILRFGNLCQTPLRTILWFCGGVSQVEPDPVLSCGVTCHSQDGCPSPMFCKFREGERFPTGVCWDTSCESSPVCICDGPDSVCGGSRVISARCAVAAGLCTCSGTTLTCPGILHRNSVYCSPAVTDHSCIGRDWVYRYQGEVHLSQRNAPQCAAAPVATACYQLCDPATPGCDPGLTCTRTEDGLNRCMGGIDSTGYDCTTWPSLTGCYARCDPDTPLCDPGLTCRVLPDSDTLYRCGGGIDSTGRSCLLPASTSGQPATSVVDSGACFDTCDPDDPTGCLAGLSCLPRVAGGEEHICYNEVICNPDVTQQPNVTQDPGVQTCTCGNGVCEQNRCSEFQQNCPADCGQPQPPPISPPPAPVCGDGTCNGGETCWSCAADCGPC